MSRRTVPIVSKRHVDDAGCFASDGEQDLIELIDASGAWGRDGRDGQSFFAPPRTPGTHGRRGGDASRPQNGQAAGNVHLQLGYALQRRDTGVLTIDGSVDKNLEIGESGYVFIRASGGKGGNGGRGGDGQPGSTGTRGRDATRYTWGTNGGPGGNGGNAGNPTDGADGGSGGDATLIVSQRDQGLLMLVKGNLNGGDIGFAGEGGRGGSGGKGGKGGSSHHWTETRSYTDSKGNRRTRTVFRSNPGGSNGRRGRDGASSAYRARDGHPGRVGEFRIVVVGQQGQQTAFGSPYDLQLVTFDVAPEYKTIEPDSLISVDKIVIRNCGGMPTPSNYTIRIFLRSDRWLIYDEVDLVLHQSLQPGEKYTFLRNGLRVRVGDYVVDEPRKNPFRLRHPVNPQARMESGIARPFRRFENGEDIHVRFPVELMAITSLNSLAPGESTRIIWGVTNVSSETFDQKYLYRAVRSNLRLLGGDLDAKYLAFFDTADAPHDIQRSEFTRPIQELRPGDTCVIETRIGIQESNEVVPYQGFAVGVDVDLQRPKSSDQHQSYRRVDYRKTFIRVSERYLRQQGSRFLLIANQKTTVNDIEKWTQLADYFGSGLDVWDVSYYGFLDLVRAVDQDKSLLRQWEGMTIIIPNNYYQTPNGTTVAFEQLAKSQFLRAAADFDINFYIVGDSRRGGSEMLQDSLIPIDDVKSPSALKNQREFLRAIKKWNQYIARSEQIVGGAATGDARDFADVSLGAVHEFDIDKRTILFQPGKKWLEKRAIQLQKKLQKEDPLHRWVIVHRYDTGDTDTSWGFFRKRNVGTLEVRRTLDSTKGSAVLYEVDGIDAIDRDFITSEANKHGIFLALKFEDKVDRFIRLVSERTFPRFSEDYIDRPLTDDEVRVIGRELVDSILTDVFNEQKVARESKIWGRWGVRALTPKLNYLAERALNYGVTHEQMQENEVNLGLLYDLIANIRYMADESKSGWDSAWLPTSFFKRSRAVSSHMLNRADRIVTNIFGREPSWWDKASSPDDDYNPFGGSRKKSPKGIERREADQQIAQREARLHQENASISKYATAQDHPGLTYDPELLAKSTRVMSGEAYDRLVAKEAQAGRHRYETEKSVLEKRSDLLVPMRKVEQIGSERIGSEQGRVTTTQQSS